MYVPNFRLPPLLATYLFFGWFSIFPQILFYTTGVTGWSGLRDALLYSNVWFLVPALLSGPVLTRVMLLIAGAMGICSLAKFGNFMVFGQELSQSVFVATMETNPGEAAEFFQHFVKWWMPVLGVLYVLPMIWFYRHAHKGSLTRKQRITLISIVSIFFIQPFVSQATTEKATKRIKQRFETVEPWSMALNYYAYQANLAESTQMVANMEAISKDAVVKNNDNTEEQTYVLVLGESTSRERLSLYGYPRKTNPELETIRDELLLYTDVAAVIPYTIESLSSTLSFTDPENLKDVYHEMNVITLMKKVGFKTFWITNQQTLSGRNTLLTALANLTDEQVFLNNNRRQSAASYDDVVLAPFDKALHDPAPKKLIIVHLIGAHFAYEYRYPESAAVFNDSNVPTKVALSPEEVKVYNQYDNAIHFNDHVVHSLIELYRKQDPYGFLLYFADHGEEVFDNRNWNGRSMTDPTPQMYDVPFMLWPAPKWAATQDMAALRATTSRPGTHRNFLHGWCDIARISFDKCDPSLSLFGKDYKPAPRFVGTGSDKHSYDDVKKKYQR